MGEGLALDVQTLKSHGGGKRGQGGEETGSEKRFLCHDTSSLHSSSSEGGGASGVGRRLTGVPCFRGTWNWA